MTVSTEEAVEDIRNWLAGEESEFDYNGLFDLAGLIEALLRLWKMAGFEAVEVGG